MRLYLLALSFLFLGNACTKDTEFTTFYQTNRINASNHRIAVYLYDTLINRGWSLHFELKPQETYTDEFIQGWKYDPDPNIDTTFADSILVVFDGRYPILHYKNNTSSSPAPYYPRSSKRNLWSELSYKVTVIKEKRQFYRVTRNYTFTDQDYDDAKR